MQDDSHEQWRQRPSEKVRSKVDKVPRYASAFGLPVIGGRRHDEHDGESDEDERAEMQRLLGRATARSRSDC